MTFEEWIEKRYYSIRLKELLMIEWLEYKVEEE